MSKLRVLVVEDDEELGAQIREQLDAAGYETIWRKDGDRAKAEDPANYALVILDLMLPGTYGMDVLKHYRKRSDVPVIILSARNETGDKVRGLSLGADDYMTKPFWPEELVARVEARLRRPVLQRGERITVGPLTIDLSKREVLVGDEAVELTRAELEILAALAQRPGSAMSRAALVQAALDPDRQGTERTLDVHVSRLRKKLGDEGARIETVWGVGYRLRD
ncbi:MAG: response regulator transcription factor [Myxococcota bacterium]